MAGRTIARISPSELLYRFPLNAILCGTYQNLVGKFITILYYHNGVRKIQVLWNITLPTIPELLCRSLYLQEVSGSQNTNFIVIGTKW